MLLETLEPRRFLAGNGLNAVYYDNADFTGATVRRVDAAVSLDVGTGSPAPGIIGRDTFSVRWTGLIEPAFSQTYTFYTHSNDGVRLWVNGRLLVNNWTQHTLTENRGSITLTAGRRYDLRMEFFEGTGTATARLLWSSPSVGKQVVPTSHLTSYDVSFAVIGDYGLDGPDEAAVAQRIHSWRPDFIITTGDNNYYWGEAATIDANVGKHYHEYIAPYHGAYGSGSPGGVNRFFPTLGNHDWHTPGAQPYLDYFTLPGNERYYDFVRGPVQLFAVDSDPREPDGIDAASTQAQWLQRGLAASTAPWQLVYFHHSPYSSGPHGSDPVFQWPFKQWGADAVVTGHDHLYERLNVGGLPYFVNGLGGVVRYEVRAPVPGSQVRYNADFGAMLVQANDQNITFQFITKAGTVIDTLTHSAGRGSGTIEATVPRLGPFGDKRNGFVSSTPAGGGADLRLQRP